MRVFLTLLLFLPITLKAQFGGAAWNGYSFHNPNSESYQNFFKSYNAINSSTIDQPFDTTWNTMSGPSWQLTFFTGNDGFQYRANSGVSYLNATNQVFQLNGDSRLLRLKTSDWNVDMGIGYGSRSFYFNVNLGLNLRMSTLYSSFIFANGIESFGVDHKLNGVYTAWRLTGLLGATMGIGIGQNMQLVCRADWVPNTQDDETYKADYSDLTDFKSDNSSYFPQDMYGYVNNQFDLFNNVYNDFSGMRYTLALQFSIYN